MVQYNWVCIKFLFTFSVKKNLRFTLVHILIGKKICTYHISNFQCKPCSSTVTVFPQSGTLYIFVRFSTL